MALGAAFRFLSKQNALLVGSRLLHGGVDRNCRSPVIRRPRGDGSAASLFVGLVRLSLGNVINSNEVFGTHRGVCSRPRASVTDLRSILRSDAPPRRTTEYVAGRAT